MTCSFKCVFWISNWAPWFLRHNHFWLYVVWRGIVLVRGRLNGSCGLATSKHPSMPLTNEQLVWEPLGIRTGNYPIGKTTPCRCIYTGRLYMGWPPPSEPTDLTATGFYDIMMLPPLCWWSKNRYDTPHDSWTASVGIPSCMGKWPVTHDMVGCAPPFGQISCQPYCFKWKVIMFNLQSFRCVGTVLKGERGNLDTGHGCSFKWYIPGRQWKLFWNLGVQTCP